MNANELIEYVIFPAIFLVVATVHPGNLIMKIVCVALAYYSLVLVDGWMFGNDVNAASGLMGKSTSPFGLVFLAISLWGYMLIASTAGKRKEKS
jgi:hypothetical protein